MQERKKLRIKSKQIKKKLSRKKNSRREKSVILFHHKKLSHKLKGKVINCITLKH